MAFDWNHSYGPMTWPRDGKTLLDVETSKPAYLKAETLDRFDGRRWVRAADGGDGRPARRAARAGLRPLGAAPAG